MMRALAAALVGMVVAVACGDDAPADASSSISTDVTGAATTSLVHTTTDTGVASSAASVASSGVATSDGSQTSSGSAEAITSTTGVTSHVGGTTTGTTAATEAASSGPGSDGTTGAAAVCGNGVLEADEICDDGNLGGGDGCEADCTSSDDVQPLWTLEQGGPFGFADCGGDTAFDSEDNLVLAGLLDDQIWVGKYDGDYNQLWEVTYPAVNGSGGCLEVRVAIDAEDNVAVIGPQGSETELAVFVAKLDNDGVEQWTATFAQGMPLAGNPGDIAFDSLGNVLLTGELPDPESNLGYWVQALDADGVSLWADNYLGPGCCINGGRGIAAGPDDDVWAVGYESPGLYTTDVFMRHYDVAGALLDTAIVPSVDIHSQDVAYAIALDDAGNRIVGGTFRPDADVDDNDAWIQRYDGDMEIWSSTFEGTGYAEDFAVGLALAPDETIVVSGVLYDAEDEGLRNRWLAKLTGDGETVWQRRAPHESADEAWRGVSVAADGRIAVAGVASFAFPWMAEARHAVYPP